jgi:hypothetical protein
MVHIALVGQSLKAEHLPYYENESMFASSHADHYLSSVHEYDSVSPPSCKAGMLMSWLWLMMEST